MSHTRLRENKVVTVTFLNDIEDVGDTRMHDKSGTFLAIDEDTTALAQNIVAMSLATLSKSDAVVAHLRSLLVVSHSLVMLPLIDDIFIIENRVSIGVTDLRRRNGERSLVPVIDALAGE